VHNDEDIAIERLLQLANARPPAPGIPADVRRRLEQAKPAHMAIDQAIMLDSDAMRHFIVKFRKNGQAWRQTAKFGIRGDEGPRALSGKDWHLRVLRAVLQGLLIFRSLGSAYDRWIGEYAMRSTQSGRFG
jgi:hypothetical protein